MKKYVLSFFVLINCFSFMSAVTIRIKNLDRTTYTEDVDSDITVGELKERLLESGRYPGAVNLRIVHERKVLEDNRQLSDLEQNIEEADITIIPVMQALPAAVPAAGPVQVTVRFIATNVVTVVTIDATKTIRDLKDQIGRETGENVTKLVFKGQVLDDSTLISSAGVAGQTVMAVVGAPAPVASAPVASASMDDEIFVKMPDGSILTPAIAEDDTFADLKFLLAMQLGVQPDKLRLTVDGSPVPDASKVFDVIVNRDQLVLVRIAGPSAPAARSYGSAPASGSHGGFVPAPAQTGLSHGQKVGAGLTIAALTAAVAGLITRRSYRKKKELLIKKYALGSLTPLQNKIWLAIVLASYRMPWSLRSIVRNNAGTITDFLGDDPRAAAELYYGHTPSKIELNAFLQNFFAGIE